MRRMNIAGAALGSALACASVTAYAQSADYRQIYAFSTLDGGFVPAGLSSIGTKLYGVTIYGDSRNYGTVFSFDPATGVETVLYDFRGGVDGENPSGGLIQIGDLLYGMTSSGGSSYCFYSCGTVYSLNPSTGAEKVVHRFPGGSGGYSPIGTLVPVGQLLYGITLYGGSTTDPTANGTLFSLDPRTGVTTTVHAFTGSDGSTPTKLINVGTMLYGTAANGGVYGFGTVFSFNPATGIETVLYSFKPGGDGEYPNGLIRVGGTFYGTTRYGGSAICINYADCAFGTVFSLDGTTGAEKVLYAFKGGDDGASVDGDLLIVGDTLVGDTFFGGSTLNCVNSLGTGCGTVFTLNLSTHVEQVLHSFQGGGDGSGPTSLIKVGDLLYGTAAQGGGSKSCDAYDPGCGTVFQISR